MVTNDPPPLLHFEVNSISPSILHDRGKERQADHSLYLVPADCLLLISRDLHGGHSPTVFSPHRWSCWLSAQIQRSSCTSQQVPLNDELAIDWW